MQKYRDFSLDFVRAAAILLIIFFHYNCATVRIISNEVTLSNYYGNASDLGVSMFFVLSGASLMLSTQFKFSIKHFYKKRFFAIFPLFWTIYILVVLAMAIILQTNYFVGLNRLSFLLTIVGLDGFLLYKIPNYYLIGEWFLGCIIILYAVFPVLKYLFDKNRYVLLAASFATSILIERFCHLDMELMRFPLFRLCEFVFGMYFVTTCRPPASLQQNYIVPLAVMMTVLSTLLFIFRDDLFMMLIIRGMLAFVILTVFASVFKKYIPVKGVYFLGSCSYAAFLSHHVILTKIVEHYRNILTIPYYNYAIFFLTVIIIYAFSFVITRFVQALMRYLSTGMKQATLETLEKGQPGVGIQPITAAEPSESQVAPYMAAEGRVDSC